jgi:diguanylate cyclase (GGDEF)-like protein
MHPVLFAHDDPQSVARVRGVGLVVLALTNLGAGYAAGGMDNPLRTALAPLFLATLGLVIALRPVSHPRAREYFPFLSAPFVAISMATAPPLLAPLGLAYLVLVCTFGSILLSPGLATALACWGSLCLVAWSTSAGRPVLADALVGISAIAVGSVVAQLAAHSRRTSLESAQLARNRAEELSLRDPLTGLPNRRAFDAEAELRAGDERLGGILMIDVDHFKAVNDFFGHAAGDEVLVAIGQSISSAVRRADLTARVGGDEFAVLLEGPMSIEGIRRVADAVRGATSAHAAGTQAGFIRVTTSIGGALAPLEESPARRVRTAGALADRALYEAKKAGRDRAVIDGETLAPSARRGRRRPRPRRAA